MPVAILSWNVAGLTTFLEKSSDILKTIVKKHDVDVICLQETKLSQQLIPDIDSKVGKLFDWDQVHISHNVSESRKGHAGVCTISKMAPNSVSKVIDSVSSRHPSDADGRILVSDFGRCIVVNVYVPNSGSRLVNITKRLFSWDHDLHDLVTRYQLKKPTILLGDLNVAADERDIYDPKRHSRSPGFTAEERYNFAHFYIDAGWIDTWRTLHPREIGYTFYSNRGRMREKGLGWRLDYFLVNKKDLEMVMSSEILTAYPHVSDHLPILLKIGPR